LINAIDADLAKLVTHKLFTEPLGNFLTNLIGGNGQASGGGGLLGSGFLGKLFNPGASAAVASAPARNSATRTSAGSSRRVAACSRASGDGPANTARSRSMPALRRSRCSRTGPATPRPCTSA
jgi:hypothetical protein